MNQMIKDAALLAAIGAAGYCAYRSITPMEKNRISRDVKRTVGDLDDVRHDMTRMAGTIKDTF